MNQELVKKYFHFLIEDYGLKRVKARKESWGYHAEFVGPAVTVVLTYETREHYLYVRLIGKEGEGFDLDHVAGLSGKGLASPDGQTVEETVCMQAEKLKTYGRRLLAGDFSQVPALRSMQRTRLGTGLF